MPFEEPFGEIVVNEREQCRVAEADASHCAAIQVTALAYGFALSSDLKLTLL